jgi:ABC-2 type transport system ATP-binding protein
MRSALSVIIGLAARAEVTLFDEPYAGLDVIARRMFYDRLLADYAEHPRTIVLSTHLVDEVAGLLERVVMLDRGRITLDAPADDVRGAFTAVSGAAVAVDEFIAGRAVRDRRRIASQESVVIAGGLRDGDRAWAAELHLSVEPLSLQQVMVHAAGDGGEQTKERTSA